MTWTAILIIIIGIIFKFLTSPPSALVGWVLNKFELHPKLDVEDITIAYNGKYLEEEEKNKFTTSFNEAQFLNKNHIYPGSEASFLHPEPNITPHIIYQKRKNTEVTFFVFSYRDHVDVVKQWKKKMASYTLNADDLQKFAVSDNQLSKA